MAEFGIEGSTFGRRQLLLGALVSTAAVAALGPVRPAVEHALDRLPLLGGDDLAFDRTSVASRIGETFRVLDDGLATTRLVVESVGELPFEAARAAEDQFVVRLTHAAGRPLPAQDTYRFDTRSFGRIPLFVTPVVDDRGAVVGYDVLVDRFVPPDAEAAP